MTTRTYIIDIAVIKSNYEDPIQNTDQNIKYTEAYPKNDTITAADFKLLFFNNNVFSPINDNALSSLKDGNGVDISDDKKKYYREIMSLNYPKVYKVPNTLVDVNEVDLPEMLLEHIENNLNFNRDMFTKCSSIAFTKNINTLRYFSNIIAKSSNSIVCHLTWSEIMQSVYYLTPKTEQAFYNAVLRITVYLETTTVQADETPTVPSLGIAYDFNVRFSIDYPYNTA